MKLFVHKRYLLKFLLTALIVSTPAILDSCSSFKYVTFDRNDTLDEDPEPNYYITLDPSYQEFTNYMFIGNRIEYFGTYFNTFFNASQCYDDAYDDYEKKVLTHYSERLDSILVSPKISTDAHDNFEKAIEKASKVIQYHKSSAFMDRAVLLIGMSYYYLGDYLKAERKFNEFASKLSMSPLIEEAFLYLAKTQMRLQNFEPALARLNELINTSQNKTIVAESFQALAEYYISQKDYESAIKDYQKSIELSSDNSFKAQLQFLIATVITRTDQLKGSAEYLKVLDFNTSYDLEFLARYNSAKYAVLGGDKSDLLTVINKLNVKYKDDNDLLPRVLYLRGLYYESRKDYKNAVKEYQNVIRTFPKTPSSAESSSALAKYYEFVKGDYLQAYRFYKYALEESTAIHDYYRVFEKSGILKKYFDLRSVIAGNTINIDYDSVFYKFVTKPGTNTENNNGQNGNQPIKGDEGKNKGGGFPGSDSTVKKMPRIQSPVDNGNLNTSQDSGKNNNSSTETDSLKKEQSIIDSLKIRTNKVLDAKFELAELFLYDLDKTDSAEAYLNEAFEGSNDPEFKAKVLYTESNLYRNENKEDKADNVLKRIIAEYPFSTFANQSRKLLNLPEVDLVSPDAYDSVYKYGETRFADNDYTPALEAFKNICDKDTTSKYYIRSSYAAGWIYENVLNKPDSAVKYYSKILSADPKSDICKLVTDKLTFYKESIQEKEDSLKRLENNSSDSLKNNIDTLNKGSRENKEEIKGNRGENQQGQNGVDNTNVNDPANNPDLKKENGPKTEPDNTK